jgi:hypothetical protein
MLKTHQKDANAKREDRGTDEALDEVLDEVLNEP